MIKGLVSIIVPVYNVEKYLKISIESMLNQTYPQIEIILIDDGSIDNSGRICDDYALHYTNVRVQHQQNGGVSKARNVGLELMQGEFFSFVDGDDTIDPTFIETMVKEMENDVDLVRLSWTRGNVVKTYYNISFDESGKYVVSLDNLKDLLWFANIWGLFRSDCLKETRFDEQMKYAEDSLFLFQYFIKSPTKRMILVDKPFYHYTIAENSATVICAYERYKRSILFLDKLDSIGNIAIDLDNLKNKYIYKDCLSLYFNFIDKNISIIKEISKKEVENKIKFLRKKGCREYTLGGKIVSFIYRHHLHFVLTLYRKLKSFI